MDKRVLPLASVGHEVTNGLYGQVIEIRIHHVDLFCYVHVVFQEMVRVIPFSLQRIRRQV